MFYWKIVLPLLIFELISRSLVTCYVNHSALAGVVFTNIRDPEDDVHSEYYYGRCATRSKQVVAHHHWTYKELQNKMIVRGWIPVYEAPTCVYVRAKSPYGDIVRYHAFKFNVCIVRLRYVYDGKKFTYYYYEWYIPVEMMKGIDWDLFFYKTW